MSSLRDSLGLITLTLVMMLVLLIILKPSMPLRILYRARPVMIAALLVWIVAFAIGAVMFLSNLMAGP